MFTCDYIKPLSFSYIPLVPRVCQVPKGAYSFTLKDPSHLIVGVSILGFEASKVKVVTCLRRALVQGPAVARLDEMS